VTFKCYFICLLEMANIMDLVTANSKIIKNDVEIDGRAIEVIWVEIDTDCISFLWLDNG